MHMGCPLPPPPLLLSLPPLLHVNSLLWKSQSCEEQQVLRLWREDEGGDEDLLGWMSFDRHTGIYCSLCRV